MHASLIGGLGGLDCEREGSHTTWHCYIFGCLRLLLNAVADLFARRGERVSLVEGAAATRKNA